MVYFSYISTEYEKALLNYLLFKIKNKNSNSKDTRNEKIIVAIAEDLNLPISRFWYKFGYVSLGLDNSTSVFDVEQLKGIITTQSNTPNIITQLDNKFEEYDSKYKISYSANKIRETQYLDFNNFLYNSIREVEQLIFLGKLNSKNEKFEDFLFDILINLPTDRKFKEVNELFSEYIKYFKQFKHCNNSDYEIIKDGFEKFKDMINYIFAIHTIKNYNESQFDIKKYITDNTIRTLKGQFKHSIIEIKRTINYDNSEYMNLNIDTKEKVELVTGVYNLIIR